MSIQFKKAEKKALKLRLALFGPSGAGKTFTALRVATGLARAAGGRIAVLDTEYGSASIYADQFDFDTITMSEADNFPPTIANVQTAIKMADDAGYSVLVIDSLSHAWRELLEEVDGLAKAKYRGNTHSAWADGTPKQKQLVGAILGARLHIIATMRANTEWLIEDNNGKKSVNRVGLKPEQGKGIEYEFTLLAELTVDHYANVVKDRTGRYQDHSLHKPGEAWGEELHRWIESGVPLVDGGWEVEKPRFVAGLATLKPPVSLDDLDAWHQKAYGRSVAYLTRAQRVALWRSLQDGTCPFWHQAKEPAALTAQAPAPNAKPETKPETKPEVKPEVKPEPVPEAVDEELEEELEEEGFDGPPPIFVGPRRDRVVREMRALPGLRNKRMWSTPEREAFLNCVPGMTLEEVADLCAAAGLPEPAHLSRDARNGLADILRLDHAAAR